MPLERYGVYYDIARLYYERAITLAMRAASGVDNKVHFAATLAAAAARERGTKRVITNCRVSRGGINGNCLWNVSLHYIFLQCRRRSSPQFLSAVAFVLRTSYAMEKRQIERNGPAAGRKGD